MKTIFQTLVALILLGSVNTHTSYAQESEDFFKIRVVDEDTGRGVPLVELETTNSIRYYTDNNGVIAFNEPGLMYQDVFFNIKSHGYEYPADGFGFRGVSLFTSKKDSALIKIGRINIAERLYRITGQGLYHHSILIGHPVPLKHPVLNGKVTGQDSFVETLYKGKIYWFWGDTNKPSYPLGNYNASGASSELPGRGGLDPNVGIDLTYFVDSNGFSKHMCPIERPGPVWIGWLATIDDAGTERLVCSYTRVNNVMQALERGIAVFDDDAEIFKPILRFEPDTPIFPDGRSVRVTVDGVEYLYFSFSSTAPYCMRVQADMEYITNMESYEFFTCLVAGSQNDNSSPKLDRDPDGRLIYSWKSNAKSIDANQQLELIKSGKITQEEALVHLQDIVSGSSVEPHSGSVFWNEYRKRWVMIFSQKWGTSLLGEVWYAEGDTPTGPWVYARKIVTHDKYSFYNVGQHPVYDQDNGQVVYFEGTYTQTFSNSPVATPRYDYNQIMYSLNLKDPRLSLPAPVYSLSDKEGNYNYMMREAIDSLYLWENINEISFYAVPANKKMDKLVPVYLDKTAANPRLQVGGKETGEKSKKLLFYALPASFNEQEQISEIWECNAGGFPITMKIKITDYDTIVSFEEESLVVKNSDFTKDTLVLKIKNSTEEIDYVLTTSIKDGKMNGNVKVGETKEILPFEGRRNDSKSKQAGVEVPLYEYQNEHGKYYYSTDSELLNIKRSEKPICNVWRNPSTVGVLDYDAKPAPILE